MLLCFIMNEGRNVWFIARILTWWILHFIMMVVVVVVIDQYREMMYLYRERGTIFCERYLKHIQFLCIRNKIILFLLYTLERNLIFLSMNKKKTKSTILFLWFAM
jgi:hypothetical protein